MLLVSARRLEPDPRGFGTHEQLGLTPCYFQELTGKVCPLCGGTTAWVHVLRGELAQAVRSNLAATLLCVGAVIGSLWLMWVAAHGRRPRRVPTSRVVLAVASVWLAVAVCDWLRKVLIT